MHTTAQPIYQDPSKSVDERISDLLARMTIEEKMTQLLHESKAVERLGIPEYNWWNEALHGVGRAGLATVFPQAIGMAATFDPELLFRVATAISDEARAKYHAASAAGNRGRYKGLTVWTPNINIFRDPRWGRGQETYGEDPFLTSQMGVAFVKGLQGNDPKYLKLAACAKHYAVHSGPEALRHEFNAVVSLKDLHETYLPAFKALVEAGVEAVMGAYNRTNGEPCCGSKLLLLDILRGAWNFQGHVVSDCWAIQDFHLHHKVTASPEKSVALALNTGCDLNCGNIYEYLPNTLKEGLIDEQTIDRALTRLLKTRFKLGMFDPQENVPYTKIAPIVVNCDAHRQLAREAAQKSIVLLKNSNNLLPLNKPYKKILALGPNAANIHALLGNYFGLNNRLVTVLEGLTERCPENTTLEYVPGCLMHRDKANPISWSLFEARAVDVVIAVFGVDVTLEGEEGEAIASETKGDRLNLHLPAWQETYLRQLKECGTPVVLVLAAGSPVIIPEDLADAILFMWYPGEEGGHAVADILFGDVAPSGKLPLTFPKSLDQLPPFEEYSMKGRTYRYMTEEPLFPFGFGLSYTTFAYHDLQLSADTLSSGALLDVTVSVTNTGTIDAEEVVQLYLTDLQASAAVPLYALKGFQRVSLKAKETKTVSFMLTPEMMALVNETGESVLEPGEFKVTIGGATPCARSEQLGAPRPVSATFTVKF